MHMPKKLLSLNEKIFRISKECPTIPRNGVGEQSDPNKPLYAFVKIEDILEAVNPLLRKYKLILTGNVAKEPMMHIGKTFATSEVMVEWTLTDLEAAADSAARDFNQYNINRVYRVPGAGCDDQGKGIYKAITGSRKYAMVLIFNLKFGDEPEEVRNATRSEERPAGNNHASVS